MTTYSPVGPFTLADEDPSTVPVESSSTNAVGSAATIPVESSSTNAVESAATIPVESSSEALDALPLLDARLLSKTIAPHLALGGSYLALSDEVETRLLALEREITHLGRGPDADIRFDDHRVSRDHAVLVRHGRYLRLLDNRSANGTFVNGRRIVARTLCAGDVIDLGPVRMQLSEVA